MKCCTLESIKDITMKFTKMHGLGNDHIVIDLFKEELPDPQAVAPQMCDRHLGIGADGLMLIGPSEKHDFRLRVINGDGSEAEMCGNGIRCLARYAVESGLTDKSEFVMESLKGVHHMTVRTIDGKFVDVTTSMGVPVLNRAAIPMTGPDDPQVVNEPFEVDGKTYNITLVNMGNPHCVVFVDNVDTVDLADIGPIFERHPAFPERINAEFVQVLDKNNLRMRVWERGCGETLACGTGAAASVVAGVLNGHTHETASVHLTYGALLFEWKDKGEIFMTGGADNVFTGDYPLK